MPIDEERDINKNTKLGTVCLDILEDFFHQILSSAHAQQYTVRILSCHAFAVLIGWFYCRRQKTFCGYAQ